ncbi:trans-sulfuration enzyme family protein [Nocardioides sambongensis]|uniref:trans-sulfuration enzyme family protein n=1 Tax=Nocardioides sambongensis TaxID=2589074 RepID=UPI00112D68EA|nr:aminotransferase class I/II-fold pyridoxal phosphate-dependent enzyme [Nocardioides sambongensis]
MTDPTPHTARSVSPATERDHGLRPNTVAVTAGRPRHVPDQPLNTPITMASTYVAAGDLEYGRYGNPTWDAFEEALGALEGGRALTFGSGMAAASLLLDLVGDGGTVIAPRHAYQGSLVALGDAEMRGRLRSTLVDISDTDAVIAAMTEDEDTALLWIESPTNPALEVADIPRLAAAARELGVRVVVDNTFATPLLQKPLELGADIVLHSATKYIAGHSDVLLGALVTDDDEIYGALKARRDMVGNSAGPFEVWLALRGLRTLPVRLERAQQNAQELARRLADHPAIEEVRYPGMGAILAPVLASADHADLLVRSTALWVHATSLGGVESTFERRRRWKTEASTIPEGLVRMSVGIEDVEDLWADLAQALDQLPR